MDTYLGYVTSWLELGSALAQKSISHVKWFVDSSEVYESGATALTWTYTLSSPAVWIWIAITISALIVAWWLDRKLDTPRALSVWVNKHTRLIQRAGGIALGLFLLSISALWGVVLTPGAYGDQGILAVMQGVQIAVGIMLIVGIWQRLAGVLLGILVLAVGVTAGWVTIAENAILLGLAAYIYLINIPKGEKCSQYQEWGIPIVRIATGITLITLAFTEKFLFPELSGAFLEEHQWNFMQGMLPWFSNELFVLSVGFTEMLFGLLFIAGYITRITTIAIALFFATSVTTMLFQKGKWEAEDLVVYAAAILLLAFGSGRAQFKKIGKRK